jgi:putative AlgH/UPF0301 family transcriptional regulator
LNRLAAAAAANVSRGGAPIAHDLQPLIFCRVKLAAWSRMMTVRQDPDSKQRPSRAGSLLIASPYAYDTPFARTVVLLLQDDDEAGVGVVVDEPFLARVQQLQQHHAARFSGRPSRPRNRIELEVGMIVWHPDVLAQEIARGMWLTAPAAVQPPDGGDLWATLVRSVGRSVLRDALDIDTDHVDPRRN